jgi:hypothetical protein
MDFDAAERLVEKLRRFVSDELDEEERPLFAALIAPGVARAYGEVEVEGFELTEWEPDALPRTLVEALREAGVRVEGLGL